MTEEEDIELVPQKGDGVERVETTRFLGPEFLAWLWFKAELLEGEFKRPDGSSIEIWLDSQLALRCSSDATERVQFKGVAPSSTPEAKLALSRNKVPVAARVSLTLDTKDFTFVFDAESFSFGSVKLPQVLTGDNDEQFFERMELLELLDELWSEQYSEFLSLRLSKLWEKDFMPAVSAWLKGEEGLTARSYRGLVQRASSAAS